MSQFNYTLPSGANFVMQAPVGTTQAQADVIFYSQVAAGALVGFNPGQSISSTTSSLAKFDLSRLDRGTAGVNDTVILAIINGLPTVADLPQLLDIPLENPITSADLAQISESGFTAPAIGSLTSNQTQAIMAQVANSVDQPATEISNEKGVGQYGLSCQQLEMAGYVKPGTWQQFIKNGSGTLTDVLDAPGIWTGKDGVNSADDFLNNINAQNSAQTTLMVNGYNSLSAAGVITTPAAQSVSVARGVVYTGAGIALTAVTSTLTNGVNAQIGSLVANASRFGTQLTAQWANGLPSLTGLTSNLTSIKGLSASLSAIPGIPSLGTLVSGITPNLTSVKTAMDTLAKGSQFATTASSALTGGLNNLSNLNVSSLTASLPSVAGITSQIQGQATALLGQAQGQAQALLGQAQGQFSALQAQGDSLVASVQKAAGFSNTVNRATVDVAMVKIFGSSKIPVPGLGAAVPDSASLAAALDIGAAQDKLKELQGGASRLLGGVQNAVGSSLGGINSQVTALTGTARGAVNSLV